MINLKKDFSLNVDVNRHSFKNCLRENGMEKLRRRMDRRNWRHFSIHDFIIYTSKDLFTNNSRV